MNRGTYRGVHSPVKIYFTVHAYKKQFMGLINFPTLKLVDLNALA
ncbi:MAG: hypothetical protein ACC609_09050 [Methanobacterium formicicum]